MANGRLKLVKLFFLVTDGEQLMEQFQFVKGYLQFICTWEVMRKELGESRAMHLALKGDAVGCRGVSLPLFLRYILWRNAVNPHGRFKISL